MNRKFRELIPLFAIALMIIGAVALLIVMNQDSSKKKTTKKEETKIEKEVKEDKKDEVSKPVADAKDTTDKKEETEKTVETITSNNASSTTTSTTTTKKDDKGYIESMVSNIMNGTTVKTTSNTTTTTQTEVKTEPVVNKEPVAKTDIPVQTQPQVQVQPQVQPVQPTQTISQSKTQTAKATAYVIKKSVNIGSYTVAVTSNNNLICYNTSSKIVNSTQNIPNTTSLLSVYNGRVYAYVPSQQAMRVYTVNNGVLKLVNTVVMPSCENFVVTANYVFVLRNDERIYAYKITNGEVEQAQSGFTNESGGMAEIVSASGSRITAKTNNGQQYTYTFNGINFIR